MLKMDFPNPFFFPPFIADGVCVFKCLLNRDTECCRVGKESVLITLGYNSALLKFESYAGKFCACHDPLSFLNMNPLIGWLFAVTDWLAFSRMFPDVGCSRLKQWYKTGSGAYLIPRLEHHQPFPRPWERFYSPHFGFSFIQSWFSLKRGLYSEMWFPASLPIRMFSSYFCLWIICRTFFRFWTTNVKQ